MLCLFCSLVVLVLVFFFVCWGGVFICFFKGLLGPFDKSWKKSCFMGFSWPPSHAKELQRQAASLLSSRHKTFAPTYIYLYIYISII